MSYTQRFYEDWELLAVLSPQTANGTVGEHNTGYVNVGDYHRVAALVLPGEPAGASTIDIDVEEATDAAGTGAQNVTGVAPNQIVAADAGQAGCIEFQTEEMDAANDYDFINLEVEPTPAEAHILYLYEAGESISAIAAAVYGRSRENPFVFNKGMKGQYLLPICAQTGFSLEKPIELTEALDVYVWVSHRITG